MLLNDNEEGQCSHGTFLLSIAYESMFGNEQKTSTRWQQHHSQPVWQQQLQESRLLTWHLSVSGKDYIQYLICCDRGERCLSNTRVQHIHCSCVAGVKFGWQKLVYSKTGCSASSPQELAPTHTTTFTSFIHTQSTLKKCSRRTNCVQTHCTSVTTKAAMFINQECMVAAKGRQWESSPVFG